MPQKYLQIMENQDTVMWLPGSPREPKDVVTVSFDTIQALVREAERAGTPPGARLTLMAGDETVGLGSMRRALLVWEE